MNVTQIFTQLSEESKSSGWLREFSPHMHLSGHVDFHTESSECT